MCLLSMETATSVFESIVPQDLLIVPILVQTHDVDLDVGT